MSLRILTQLVREGSIGFPFFVERLSEAISKGCGRCIHCTQLFFVCLQRHYKCASLLERTKSNITGERARGDQAIGYHFDRLIRTWRPAYQEED